MEKRSKQREIRINKTLPSAYYTPSKKEVQVKLAANYLDKRETEFAQDLSNLFSGGRILTTEEIKNLTIEKNSHLGEKTLKKIINKNLRQRASLDRFTTDLDVEHIPGDSPLQKTINLLKYIANTERCSNPSELFEQSVEYSKSIREKINRKIKAYESLGEDKKDFLFGENKDQVNILESKVDGSTIRWLEKISNKLKNISSFKESKNKKIVSDPTGTKTRLRLMESINEVKNATPELFALDEKLMAYRIATKQAFIKERVAEEKKKQLLCLLIDSSGSMNTYSRAGIALAVLLNRIKAVENSDSELLVYLYKDKIRKSYTIKTREDARELTEKISTLNFASGITCTDIALQQTIKNLDEKYNNKEYKEKPEIVVLTDGEDTIRTCKENMHGYKLHSITIGSRENRDLHNLAKNTNGTTLLIKDRNEIGIIPYS